MNIKLKARKAVVTASTAGIGWVVAEGLARARASVVIDGRGERWVAQALGDLRKRFPDVELHGIAADLATPEGVSALVMQAPDADIVVSTVDTARPHSAPGLPDSAWVDLFELDLMSGARVARRYVERMIERGWGRVVFISSETALADPKDMIDYAHTKTAQLAILKGIAELIGGTGNTNNAVMPGPDKIESLPYRMMATARSAGTKQRDAEQRLPKLIRPTPLSNRLTTPEDVANLVVCVCSAQASGTIGAALRVGGGELRSSA